MEISYRRIGMIHSPFTDIGDMPIHTIGPGALSPGIWKGMNVPEAQAVAEPQGIGEIIFTFSGESDYDVSGEIESRDPAAEFTGNAFESGRRVLTPHRQQNLFRA